MSGHGQANAVHWGIKFTPTSETAEDADSPCRHHKTTSTVTNQRRLSPVALTNLPGKGKDRCLSTSSVASAQHDRPESTTAPREDE